MQFLMALLHVALLQLAREEGIMHRCAACRGLTAAEVT